MKRLFLITSSVMGIIFITSVCPAQPRTDKDRLLNKKNRVSTDFQSTDPSSYDVANQRYAAFFYEPQDGLEDYYQHLPRFSHIDTKKLSQLIGDIDYQWTPQKTPNLTMSRYHLVGTDLGSSFEHKGHVFFLFGDTIYEGGDCLAYSTTANPEKPPGLRLDFFTQDKWYSNQSTDYVLNTVSTTATPYLHVKPDGIEMKGFEVPNGGISVNGKAFLFCKMDMKRVSGVPIPQRTEKTYLVRFYPERKGGKKNRFERRGVISRVKGDVNDKEYGRFMNVTAHLTTGNYFGLPFKKPQVLFWGTGAPRASHVYLATATVDDFLHIADKGKNLPSVAMYFAGYTDDGVTLWSPDEEDAAPLFYDYTYPAMRIGKPPITGYAWDNGTLQKTLNNIRIISEGRGDHLNPMLGDVSVVWDDHLKLWLMTYDTRPETKSKDGDEGIRGVLFRFAKYPWGPWSTPLQIFSREDGFCKFIHQGPSDEQRAKGTDPCPKLAGPVISNNSPCISGGAYAPYMIERFTKINTSNKKDNLSIYYVLSTWNPYTVVLMKSRFEIGDRLEDE